MDSFLEANRLVESSLAKLKRETMPLRKALFVSNVMNRAQEVATSAHLSFMNHSEQTPSRPSKLLASMRVTTEIVEDMAVNLMESEHRQTTCAISPVALTHVTATKEPLPVQDDEVMEFISNTVLSDILKDEEEDIDEMEVVSPITTTNTHLKDTWSPLSDVSNTPDSWPSWTKPKLTLDKWQPEENTSNTTTTPPSPGKRQHDIAFPCGNEQEASTSTLSDISKRFKSSSDPLSFTSSSSLSLIPTITGFSNPFLPLSSPLSCAFSSTDSTFSLNWNSLYNQSRSDSSRSLSSHKLYSVLAY